MKINLLLASAFLMLSMLAPSAFAQSGISEKLNQSLDAMVNHTPASVEQTNRRTVITGGSLAIKLQTNRVDAFSFRPPSISVGCGGLDMFFGAFSMISKEQLVQALRAVVTGALQYAFRIALKVLCQSCEQIMSQIGSILQDANRFLGDMCNVTTNFLESKWSSTEVANNTRTRMGLTSSGVEEDNASAFSFGGALSSIGKFMDSFGEPTAKQALPELGNQLYEAMKASEGNVFTFLGSNNPFFEEMMSLIGTVVVCSEGKQAGCPGATVPPGGVSSRQEGETVTNVYPPLMKFEDLVIGPTTIDSSNAVLGTAMWRCNTFAGDYACLSPRSDNLAGFVSIKERMLNAFLGDGSSVGIIRKMRHNYWDALTPEEEIWMKGGGPIVGMVIDLATKNEEAARGWLTDHADVLAAEFTFQMLNDFMVRVRQAMAQGPTQKMSEQLDLIEKAFENSRADFVKIQAGAQGRAVAFDKYRALAAVHTGKY